MIWTYYNLKKQVLEGHRELVFAWYKNNEIGLWINNINYYTTYLNSYSIYLICLISINYLSILTLTLLYIIPFIKIFKYSQIYN
jgi:hypothetical protein